ncbi:hypothetical protein [Actomonas aquatica]|uniref:Glycosyltransferase subfamily 4-like N-terminal domain-containing protein n=1 Tax=Actomonas aquatica TaxID=2866162 RepID=A0ABZ1CA80_9BACT|nr:hypothetical protein [Opitutus sp. WL0086]WRQ88587.1 hypothetical protein K1X11_004170 [Opitutus sp. WL0086]
MKIILFAGSYPPDACGVGDYSQCLNKALSNEGHEVHIVSGSEWGFRKVTKWLSMVWRKHPDIVHIQYPSAAYGWSLIPHLVSVIFSRRAYVTIHGFIRLHLLRKLSLMLFSTARCIIFTTEAEKVKYRTSALGLNTNMVVVPIGSNINYPESADRFLRERGNEFLYFGLLNHTKGLAGFLNLVREARVSGSDKQFCIMGRIMKGQEAYGEFVKRECEALGIRLVLDATEEVVSTELLTARAVLLPYRDGANYTRGTLLAALGHGCPIFTTIGKESPRGLDDVVGVFDDWENPPQSILDFEYDDELELRLKRGIQLAKNFSWGAIGFKHSEIYNMCNGYEKGFDIH